MKSKFLFIFTIIMSTLLVAGLLFTNYYDEKIRVKEFTSPVEVEVFDKYVDKGIDVCYGTSFKCKRISYKTQGMVNTKRIGTYTLTYRVTHDKKSLVVHKKVKVLDKEAPKLDVFGTHNNVCPNGKASGVTYHAEDNYEGDITDKIKYKIKDNKIIYKVSDSSGNTTKKEFEVNINDAEKPTIVLNDEPIIYLGLGSEYKEPGYVAVDNCDGNITENVTVSGKVNVNKEGTYELTYKVSDDFGNVTEAKRTIKVFKKNNYKPGEVTNKTVYLTFDDGPGEYTERLLDILKKYDVKATFFVTGYNDKFNHLLTREQQEGHTVGLHSYSHNYVKIYASVDAYMEDLIKISDKVKNYTGVESRIIRFPGGSSNTISRRYRVGIMSTLTKKVEELGFRYFDWTIMSGDAGNTKDTNQIVRNVTKALKEDGLNVVLMHDIKPYSVNAVERIIQYGLANGYTFAPLTMESPNVHQRVNN